MKVLVLVLVLMLVLFLVFSIGVGNCVSVGATSVYTSTHC